MRDTGLLKEPFVFSLILTLSVLICALSAQAQSSEWKSAGKEDDIETFYRVEKVGADSFEVTIKVNNSRLTAVNISAASVSYKRHANYFAAEIAFEPCGLAIPSGSSRICEPIKIGGGKITDVKVQWANADTNPKPKPKVSPRRRP